MAEEWEIKDINDKAPKMKEVSVSKDIIELIFKSSFIKKGNVPFLRLPNGFLLTFDPSDESIIEIREEDLEENSDLLLKLCWLLRPGSQINRDLLDIIEVTTWDCNLRCRYCLVEGGERSKAYLSKKHVDSFFKLFLEGNDKIQKVQILFTGGEATLNPTIIKYTVDKIKEYCAKSSFFIATNGVISSEILRYLIKENFIFSISLDGSKEIHDKLRPMKGGSGSFKNVIKTIKILKEEGMIFRIRATITPENVGHMKNLVLFFKELGAEAITFEPVDLIGRASKEYPFAVEIEEYIRNYASALGAALENDMRMLNPIINGLFEPTIDPCPNFLLQKLTLLPTGHISLCNAVTDPSHPYNQLIIGEYDQKRDKFLLSKHSYDLLERIFSRECFLNSPCFSCKINTYCGGGCPYRHMYYSGSKEIAQKSKLVCELNEKLLAATLIIWWWANKT